MPRTTGNMLLLPNIKMLIINDAAKGSARWWQAKDPVLTPLLYHPKLMGTNRFRVLAPSTTPRMYHFSTTTVLPIDGAEQGSLG